MGASVAGGGVGDEVGGAEPGGDALAGGGFGVGAGCVCAPAPDESDSAESTMPRPDQRATPPENRGALTFMSACVGAGPPGVNGR